KRDTDSGRAAHAGAAGGTGASAAVALPAPEAGRTSGAVAAEARVRTGGRKGLIAGAALAAVVLLGGLWLWLTRPAAPRAAAGRKAVAVLYFSNLSQDASLDWLDRGLTEMLTTNLAQVQGIDVLST